MHTTLHCEGCVSKVKPLLDAEAGIESWSVDLEAAGVPITVHGNTTEEKIQALLAQAGYATTLATGFWKDALVWKSASLNTLNCLIGCSIGDFGTIILFQHFWPETNIFLMMGLAMINGLITSITLETILLRLREKFAWRAALRTAFGMSFLSMIVMELAENVTDYLLTQASVPLSDPFYWMALGIALVAGFIVPLPYNYYKIRKYNKACH